MFNKKIRKTFLIIFMLLYSLSNVAYAADEVINTAPAVQISSKRVPKKPIDIVVATDYFDSNINNTITSSLNILKAQLYTNNYDVKYTIVNDTDVIRQYDKINAKGYTVDMYSTGLGPGWSDWVYNDAKIVGGNVYVRLGKYEGTGVMFETKNIAPFNGIKEVSNAIQVRYLGQQIVAALDKYGKLYRANYDTLDTTQYNLTTINLSNLFPKEKIVKIAVTQGKTMALTNKGRLFVENNGTLSILKNFDGVAIKVKDISDSMVLDYDGNIYFHGKHLYYPYITDPVGAYDDPSIEKYYDFEKLNANADLLLESQPYKFGFKQGLTEPNLYKTKAGRIGRIDIISNVYNGNNGAPILTDLNFPSSVLTSFYTNEIITQSGYYLKGKDGSIKKVDANTFAITNVPGNIKTFFRYEAFKNYLMGSFYQGRPYVYYEEDTLYPEYMDVDIPKTHIGTTIIDNDAIMNVPISKDADRYLVYVSDGTGNDFTKPYGQYYGLGNINKKLANYLQGNDFNIYAVTDPATYDYKLSGNPNQELSLNELLNYTNNEGKLYDKGQFQQALDYIASKYASKNNEIVTDKNVNVLLLSDYTGYKEQVLVNKMNDIKNKALLNNTNLSFNIINDKVTSSRIGNINYKIWNSTDNKEAANFYDIANYTYNYYGSDGYLSYMRNYKLYEKFNTPKTINNLTDAVMVTYSLEKGQYDSRRYTYALRVDGTVYEFYANKQYKKIEGLSSIVQILSTEPGSLYALDKNGNVYLYGYDALALYRVGTVTTKTDNFYKRPTYIFDLTNVKNILPIYNNGYAILYNDGQATIYGDAYTISGVRIRERDDWGDLITYYKYTKTTDNAPYNLNTILGAANIIQLETIYKNNGNTDIYALTDDKRVLKFKYYTNPGSESITDFSVEVVTQNSNIKKIAVEKDNIILLLNDSTALGKGTNTYGQLANNGSALGSFTLINGISNIKDVIVNNYGSYYLTNSNELWRVGAIYNPIGYYTYSDKTVVPVKEMSGVKLFSATNKRITVITTTNTVYQKGIMLQWNSYNSTVETVYNSSYYPKGTANNATNIFDSDNFTSITSSDGTNYVIGDTGTLFGSFYNLKNVNEINGYKIAFQMADSLYLSPITDTNKGYAYGNAGSGRFNYYTKRVEYAAPVDITNNILNGQILNSGEKLIWMGLNWEQKTYYDGSNPLSYEKMFFLTNSRSIRQVTNNTYWVQESRYDSYYGWQYYNVTKFSQTSYKYYVGEGLYNDTVSIDLVNSLYQKSISTIYNEYNVSYVDINHVINNIADPSADNYFIYISDGKGNDFSKTFGEYYSISNLNNNLKQYLINNNYSINAISPIDNFEYVLPQTSDVQELTIRELAKGSVLKGRLFTNTLLDEGLNKIFSQYITEANSNVITILKDEDIVDYTKSFEDYENDPLRKERWYYEHNPNYYENSNGKASFADKWLDTTITRFSNKGEYTVTYNAQDLAKDNTNFEDYNLWSQGEKQLKIRVHERPIADFMYLYNSGSLSYTDLSYDPDHVSMANKGIVEWLWEWKLATEPDWTIGKLTTVDESLDYQVRLSVKDIEGAWSIPIIKSINTKIPEIIINPENRPWINQNINISVTVNDKSLSGLKNVNYAVTNSSSMPTSGWINKNYTGNTPTDTFTVTISNEGQWYIHVKAFDNKDGAAFKSAGLYKLDKTPPIISPDPINGTLMSSATIAISTSDSLSGVKETWYRWTTTNTIISNLTGFTKMAGNNINAPATDGTYYLHIKSYDNATNERYMIYGSYTVSSLTLTAALSPNPAKQGQRISFNVNTTGSAKYITIYFPNEIWNLDTSTPIFKQIPEQASRSDLIYYYLPLSTPKTIDNNGNRLRAAYVIQVKAEKADGTTRLVNLNLDVKGNIYDGIRTETK